MSSEENITQNNKKRSLKKCLKEMIIVLKNFAVRPTATSIEHAEKGSILSTLILFTLLAISQGFLYIIATGQLINATARHLYMFFSRAHVFPEVLNILVGESEAKDYLYLERYISSNMKLPYDTLFKHGVLLYVLIVTAMTACLFLFSNGIIKRRANLIRDFKLVTVSSISIIVMEALAMLASLITGYFNFLALIGVMISMFIIGFYVKSISKSAEKAVLFSSLLLTLMVIVTFFMVRIFINRDMMNIINLLQLL